MLRFGPRLISLDYTSYNNVYRLFTCGYFTRQRGNISSLRYNLRLSRHLAHMTMSEAVTKNPVVVTDWDTPQLVSIVSTVQNLGFTEDEIKMVMQKQPELMKTSPTLWDSILGYLVESGMEKSCILTILEKWPQILFLKKSVLDQNLQAWFECKFGEELMYSILATHPSLLQVNHLHLLKRVKQYQLYFESKKRVGKLLLLAPNTLEEDWDRLLDKLNYLNELCTEKSDIAASGVLAHTGLHIKARHEFLIRAGIYKRPQKDFHKRLSKNPKLQKIVNTSDREFAYNTAGLSLWEYEVFLEMYENELENSKSTSESYDEEMELNKLAYSKHPPRKFKSNI